MNLLLEVIKSPACLKAFSEQQWDQLLRFARHAQMQAYLAIKVKELSLEQAIPEDAMTLLDAEMVRVGFLQLQASHEMEQLSKVLFPCDYPVVLLKGAAYQAAKLPPTTGRRLSDVDLMVPRTHLDETEKKLIKAGWDFTEELNDYDERYYREWSHEIPPMRHPTRIMEIDLHHNLVAPTSRIKLDTQPLFAELVAVPGTGFYILSPEDMYLHSAAHLFFNDELRGGLRDLVDMYLLGEHFSKSPGFGERLIERAVQLGMHGPLFYALSTSQRLLGSTNLNISEHSLKRITPNSLSRSITSYLIDRIIAPQNVEQLHNRWAETLILLRAKWLNMPPLMLLKHLAYKSTVRGTDKS